MKSKIGFIFFVIAVTSSPCIWAQKPATECSELHVENPESPGCEEKKKEDIAVVKQKIRKAEIVQEKNEEALQFYQELIDTRAFGNPAPPPEYDCAKFNIVDVHKIIREGQENVKNQSHGKYVHIVFGDKSLAKTNVANLIGGEKNKIDSLNIYPRYVNAFDSKYYNEPIVVFEAPSLYFNTFNQHIAGIYLLNKAIESSKGVNFIFVYHETHIEITWNYFKEISKFNPEYGIGTLQYSESFARSDVPKEKFSKLSNRFGRNPILIHENSEITDSAQERERILADLSKNKFLPNITLPLLSGKKCLREKLEKEIASTFKADAATFMNYFKKIERDTSKTIYEKTRILNSKFTKITEVLNLISAPNGVTNAARALVQLKFDWEVYGDLEGTAALAEYGKLLGTVYSKNTEPEWATPLKDLWKNLKTIRDKFEIQTFTFYSCDHINHTFSITRKMYEIYFDIAIGGNTTSEYLKQFFVDNKVMIGESNVELIKDFIAESQNDKDFSIQEALGRVEKVCNEDKPTKRKSDNCPKEEVNKFISYIKMNSSDSNFPNIMNTTKKEIINCTVAVIKQAIPQDLARLLKPVQDHYLDLEGEESGDHIGLLEVFDKEILTLSRVLEDTKENTKPLRLLNAIEIHNADLLINPNRTIVNNLKSYAQFMDFAGEIFDQEIEDGFKDTANYLYASRRWYFFLKMLNKWFGKYEIMKNLGKYQEAGKQFIGKIRRKEAKKGDITEFLSAVDILPQKAFKDLLGGLNPSKAKLSYLGTLVDRMFSVQMEVKCTDEVTVCKGLYVLFSSCLAQTCHGAQSYEVHATNRFYLDQDVVGIGNVSSIVILAPKWHVVGKRTITLNGKDGEVHATPKALSADFEDGRGNDAKPGLPGSSAGHFLGVAQTIEIENDLTISAVGGKGGMGQEGGDGGPASIPSFNIPVDKNTPQVIKNQIRKCGECYYPVTYGPHYAIGGDGGDGGAGGVGGLAGTVLMVSPTHDQISMQARNGDPGNIGKGGLGGKGRYLRWEIRQYNQPISKKLEVDRWEWRSGKKGKDGFVVEGIKTPENMFASPNYALIANKYKFFVRQILEIKPKNSRALRFLNFLARSEKLNSFYDTFAYGDDYRKLEQQSYHLRDKGTVVKYLDALRIRVANFSSKPSLNDEDKKVVTYLYTAILGKLAGVRHDDKYVVVNPASYLARILNEFNRLRDLKNDANAIEYKESYIRDVNETTIQADNLVKNEIIPEIEAYQDKLNEAINDLAREVVKLKDDVKTERKALERKRDQLRNTVFWRKATGVLSLAMSLTSFIGPQAMIISMGIYSAAKIIETFATSDAGTDAKHAMAVIPGAVEENMGIVFKNLEMHRNLLSKQLYESEKRLEKVKSSPEIQNVIQKIQKTKEILSDTDPKSLNPATTHRINQLRDDLVLAVTEGIENVKIQNEPNTDNKKIIDTLQLVESILRAPSVPPKKESQSKEGPPALFDFSLMNDADLKEVGEEIRKNSEKMMQLDVYQDRIYAQMLPMINEIKSNLNALATANNGQSQAFLQISQWKTQDYLQEVMGTLGKMTTGFEANEEFEYMLNKCQRGVKTMLTVFQRIADNQDKAGLAVFLESINGQKAASIQVTRSDLRALVNDLERSIQNNLILEAYDRGHQTFLQSFFPFGLELFRRYKLPDQLAFGNSTDDLVKFTKERIRKMTLKIKSSESLITKYDEDIFTDNSFNKGFSKMFPAFYTWKYEANQRAISSLLEGKHVEMNADIMSLTGINSKRNAVKFNDLRIAFLPRDKNNVETVQNAMNQMTVVIKTLGTFQYQCGGKFYLINNDLFEFEVTYAEKEVEEDYHEPKDPTAIWSKIRDNAPIFSPYSTWNITLKSDIGKDPKEVLKALKGMKLDVQLYGYGSYIKGGSEICSEELDVIYDRDPRDIVPKQELINPFRPSL